MQRQYAPPNLRATEPRLFDEVRSELGYDLDVTTGANTAQVKHLTQTIPSVANRTASAWKLSAASLHHLFRSLRDERVSHQSRMTMLEQLTETATAAHGGQLQQWHTL